MNNINKQEQELNRVIKAARHELAVCKVAARKQRINDRIKSYTVIGYPLDYESGEKLCFGCTAVAIIIFAAIVLHIFASI